MFVDRNLPEISLGILGLQQELDENGDAGGSYTLFSLPDVNDDTLEGGNMTRRETTPVANFINNCRGGAYSFCLPSFSPIKGSKGIQWIGKQVPVDEPECGFTGEKCKTEKNWKQVTLIVACCSLMTIALGFIIRHYRYEQKLACLLWKVDVRDIILPRTNSEYTLQNLRSTINVSNVMLLHGCHCRRPRNATVSTMTSTSLMLPDNSQPDFESERSDVVDAWNEFYCIPVKTPTSKCIPLKDSSSLSSSSSSQCVIGCCSSRL